MGKVNLNKSSKPKNTDFKRRKSALGRGKYQHRSHTKIDMKTAQIKVLSQSRFENTEVVVEGPTVEQLNNLLNMSHSDAEKKVLQGIKGLDSILRKNQMLFVQHSNNILATVMGKVDHTNEDIRKASQNLISYLFNNFGEICAPQATIFVRRISAIATSLSVIAKQQAAILLDKVGGLQLLQPSPVIFEHFPLFIRNSPTAPIFSQFVRPIVKIIQKFSQRSNEISSDRLQAINFPRLFAADAKFFSKRFTPNCTLSSAELESIDKLLGETIAKMPKIKGDKNAVVDMCTLVLAVMQLQPNIDLSPFMKFVLECGWPFEHFNEKKNLVCARLLSYDESNIPAIKEFLEEIDTDPGILSAIVGPTLDNVDPMELCGVSIREEMQPAAAQRLAEAYLKEDHPSKKYLKKLIELKKPEKFQDILAEILETKLIRFVGGDKTAEEEEAAEEEEKVEGGEEEEKAEEKVEEEKPRQIVSSDKERERQELLIALTSASAPLETDFLKRVMELIVRKIDGTEEYYVPDEIAISLARAIAMTRTTPTKHLLSFLLSSARKRNSLADSVRRSIEFLKGYARDQKEASLFNKIDTSDLTVLK